MKITLAQLNFQPDDLEGHLDRLMEIISSERHSDLIVFPELILQGHPSDVKPEGYLYRQAKCHLHDASRQVWQHVKQCGARVVLGELRRQGDNYRNLATYMDPAGAKSYAKAHIHWTEGFVPGNKLKVFSTPLGRLGLNICYDSAFSEVWRVLALNGARLVVNISAVPAHFPVPYMRRRMRGAAAFNQYFVVYVNRPGPVFAGGSAVYGPHGDELLALGGGEEIASVEIDLEQAESWREEEVLFPNRRPLLYRRVASRNKEVPAPGQKPRLRVVG
ncbi:MAG: carbon-nitrogen hydrolase family protein [Desulfarculaceae bacterium]|nr:carbon-nitrogen hydrolase family protein [Desulfarculaceae bacterium]MCF8070817.1 carbon-nitrogen hydrolase family protein [Desulfarculaceae bacterium]MCF8102254.1 carbon-nitrogen hydrolase family protein [Desulfarculaceae bacterium]MCF8117684.1 carbon-nitrogen hydrolase family protein [Desulfarculaceae bacterium]